jgi:hypothetical protein
VVWNFSGLGILHPISTSAWPVSSYNKIDDEKDSQIHPEADEEAPKARLWKPDFQTIIA